MPQQPSSSFIARHPLGMYFFFSYAFFWLLLIGFFAIAVGVLQVDMTTLPGWLIPLLTILGSWMPSLAAAIVTGVTEGRAGVRRLFGMFFQFRLPGRWYLAAMIPLALPLMATAIYRLLGGAAAAGVPLTGSFWTSLLLINFLTGPTGEEPGWRGFALPRLLQRYSPWQAGLLLGLVWSFWHLPLWLTSGFGPDVLLLYVLLFNLGIISLNMLMTWVFMRTSHSLVPMFLMHFGYNTMLQLVSPQGLGLGELLPLFGLTAGLCFLAACVVWGWNALAQRSSAHKSRVLA